MKQEMNVLGIDSAKRVFHAVGMDNTGKVVFRQRVSRRARMPFIAKLSPMLIGMEACGGAHYWARRFRAHGHEVKLMAPRGDRRSTRRRKPYPASMRVGAPLGHVRHPSYFLLLPICGIKAPARRVRFPHRLLHAV